MSFETEKYEVIRQALNMDLVNYIALCCDIHENLAYTHRPPTDECPYPFGDAQSPNSFAWYGSIPGDALISFLKEKISQITNKQLIETYSYWRTYYNGGILEKHTDRPSCEYSVTACIKKGNTDWPIYFENLQGREVKIELEPGDLIVYKGDILPHWRNFYSGNRHIQMFVHYIDMNGSFIETNAYDGRPTLGANFGFKIREIQ